MHPTFAYATSDQRVVDWFAAVAPIEEASVHRMEECTRRANDLFPGDVRPGAFSQLGDVMYPAGLHQSEEEKGAVTLGLTVPAPSGLVFNGTTYVPDHTTKKGQQLQDLIHELLIPRDRFDGGFELGIIPGLSEIDVEETLGTFLPLLPTVAFLESTGRVSQTWPSQVRHLVVRHIVGSDVQWDRVKPEVTK